MLILHRCQLDNYAYWFVGKVGLFWAYRAAAEKAPDKFFWFLALIKKMNVCDVGVPYRTIKRIEEDIAQRILKPLGPIEIRRCFEWPYDFKQEISLQMSRPSRTPGGGLYFSIGICGKFVGNLFYYYGPDRGDGNTIFAFDFHTPNGDLKRYYAKSEQEAQQLLDNLFCANVKIDLSTLKKLGDTI